MSNTEFVLLKISKYQNDLNVKITQISVYKIELK